VIFGTYAHKKLATGEYIISPSGVRSGVKNSDPVPSPAWYY